MSITFTVKDELAPHPILPFDDRWLCTACGTVFVGGYGWILCPNDLRSR